MADDTGLASPPSELTRTALHDEHVALGGRMVPFAGFEMPVQYAGVKQEHHAVRTAAGLFDVSHMGEMELSGPDAGAVVDRLITNHARLLAPGQALYTCACNDGGTILDDLIVYRRGPEDWLVVCNASNRDKMVPHFRAEADAAGVPFADASDQTALLALQGPRALAIATTGAAADGPDLGTLGPFFLAETTLFGVRVTAARTGYTGEDGLEIFCAADDARSLWRALLDAGRADGLAPCGLAARDTLRLEARLSLYGNDIDETTNPYEAGLGWTVKLKKPSPFVGREALRAIKAAGVTRKLVGFEMTGRGIARQGYPILDAAGSQVGVCTSGSPGPTVEKNIGLGYVPVSEAAIGTALTIDCRGRAVSAVVVPTPFYRRAS
ncbi:MAG: glycine cleavage system aminomethyltransferase GcvT [Myxococcota bacterium]